MNLYTIGLLAIGATVTLLFLAVAWRVARSDRHFTAVAMLALRLGVLGLAGFLLWQAFWQLAPVSQPDDEPDSPPVRVLVLQDASASMDFLVAPGQTRQDLAEETWQTLAGLLPGPHPVELSRCFFAGNLVPEGQEQALRRHSTQLAGALGEALGRLPCDRILVISDGTASDGAVPAYLRDWAANRRLELYAVCTDLPGRPAFDVQLTAADCPPINPTRLSVRVETHGEVPGPLTVALALDGKPFGEQIVLPKPDQSVAFSLPEAAQGWHAFAASVAPFDGEATSLNNRLLGVYRQTPPNRVLLLLGAPRLESTHLARFLRSAYPDRLTVMSIHDPALATANLQSFQLAVIGNVPWARLPPRLRTLIQNRQLAHLLLLGGDSLDWNSGSVPDFPVDSWLDELNLSQRFNQEATAEIPVANNHPAFHDLDLGHLTVNLLRLARLNRNAHAAIAARTGNQQFPLLVSDSLQAPRSVVLLSDTTWKWSMNPEARIRHEYRVFWNTILAWLVGEVNDNHLLSLEFEHPEGQPELTDIRLQPRQPAAFPRLREVTLSIELDGQRHAVSPVPAEDAYTHRLDLPASLPALAWIEGRAIHQGEPWTSPRRPLVIANDSLELASTRPTPEILRSLVGPDEDRFAFAPQALPVLQQLVRPPGQRVTAPPVRTRDSSRELLLAALAVLFICVEWLVERWRHGQTQ